MRWLAHFCLAAAPLVSLAQKAPPPRPAAPLAIYTDIVSGPNSGGDDGKGIYLSVFGKNFGSTCLGTATKVFIGGVEVAGYRTLGPSRGRQDIQQITVQVGALGNPQPGVALPIKVVVDGRESDTNLSFTVNPGTIYFVSLTGNDGTGVPGAIANPYRTVQKDGPANNGVGGISNPTAPCAVAGGIQPVASVGVWGLIQPGDFIVMRGGTWTDVSKLGNFLVVQNKSGTLPTGAAGSGPITVMGYPGENVFINRTNPGGNQGGSGITSADSARQANGCGARVTITNVKVESGFNDGMISTQRGADNPAGSHWRVVNNEMTAVSCQNNTKCKGAGVAGSGAGGFWVGNHVHDVYDKPDAQTSFENLGFYVDGVGSYEIAYNRIENIYGGNGVQLYSTSTPITNNASIHHNVIRNVGKHGINLADGAEAGIAVYNNVVLDTGVAGLRINSRDLTGARIYNNTFFNTDRLNAGGARAALMNDWNLRPGAAEIRNNVFAPGGAGRNYLGGSVGFGALAATMSNNLWFGGRGAVAGSGNVIADPKFISTAAGSENFRGQAASPAIDAGSATVAPLVGNDFDCSTRRPQGREFDIGAYEAAK